MWKGGLDPRNNLAYPYFLIQVLHSSLVWDSSWAIVLHGSLLTVLWLDHRTQKFRSKATFMVFNHYSKFALHIIQPIFICFYETMTDLHVLRLSVSDYGQQLLQMLGNKVKSATSVICPVSKIAHILQNSIQQCIFSTFCLWYQRLKSECVQWYSEIIENLG